MSNNPAKLKVAIAEDDVWVSREIRRLVSEIGHEVVGEASTGKEMVKIVCKTNPDIVIVDIKMPDMDGLEACRRIQKKCPTSVVILTAYETDYFLKQASEYGAGAYLVKPTNSTELDRAIRIAVARHQDLVALQRALDREKMLLRELYHRVKNNLAMISSILYLQAESHDNEETVAALQESAGRIHILGELYDILHTSHKLLLVEMDKYLRSIIAKLRQVLSVQDGRIRLDIEADAITVYTDVALYCGLIINELVTNAVQHAFPNEKAGRIKIVLKATGGSSVELRVEDDGIGLPESMDPDTAKTLGLRLVSSFVQQLGASFKIVRENGSAFIIDCPLKSSEER